MADTVPIQLDPELRRRIEDLARQTGRRPDELIRDAIDRYALDRDGGNGSRSARPRLYDALEREGLIGCIDGPGDKSTNPKYFEGLGRE